METIEVDGVVYQVVTNVKEGWKPEFFQKRFSDILKKYDYIVGDWGYNQLRLKGFFHDRHPKATVNTKISYLEEYINEFCNFGCAYFVLKKQTQKNPSK